MHCTDVHVYTVELALNGHWFGWPLEAYGQFSMYFLISLLILQPTLWNAVNRHGNSGNYELFTTIEYLY